MRRGGHAGPSAWGSRLRGCSWSGGRSGLLSSWDRCRRWILGLLGLDCFLYSGRLRLFRGNLLDGRDSCCWRLFSRRDLGSLWDGSAVDCGRGWFLASRFFLDGLFELVINLLQIFFALCDLVTLIEGLGLGNGGSGSRLLDASGGSSRLMLKLLLFFGLLS